MKAKQEYQKLLVSGDLVELYPELKGDWKKDKEEFTKLYDLNSEVLNNIIVDFDIEPGEI